MADRNNPFCSHGPASESLGNFATIGRFMILIDSYYSNKYSRALDPVKISRFGYL